MKFIHLADLHLGKRYNELSLIDDQRYILSRILEIIDGEQPDGVFIAGDVYDKSTPSAEAVELFDCFLTALAGRKIQTFVVSGNHDSPERIAFGSRLVEPSGIHFSPVYSGEVKPVTLSDGYGKLNVYMLPFIKPATVRRFFEGVEIENYTDAVAAAVGQMNIDREERNILVAHQFVTGAKSSGSEEFIVGDAGNVSAAVFDGFDYVALGHIHGAQNVCGERVRYCGTPLKYSLSEADDEKSVTIVEIRGKGDLTVRTAPLSPKRDVRELRGEYARITEKNYYLGKPFVNDLLHVVLTDEDEVPDALGKLRLIYPNVMSLRYDNRRTRAAVGVEQGKTAEELSPFDMFAELYRTQNNQPMTAEQEKLVHDLIGKIWNSEE